MSLSDAIKKDHRELQQYYNEVVNNPGNHDHQQRYGNQFTWELARHSVAEELVVYPAFEKYLGKKGKQMAEDDRKEHRLVRASWIRQLTSPNTANMSSRSKNASRSSSA